MSLQEEAPWLGAEDAYVGWVPNVRSHLSFSLIASARHIEAFTRAYSERPKRPAQRLVVVYQERISHDLPWSARSIRKDRPDLVHQWVLEGRTRSTRLPVLGSSEIEKDAVDGCWLATEPDRQGMLLGRVHVLPHQEDADARHRQTAAISAIRRLIDRPSSIVRDASAADRTDRELDELVASLAQELRECTHRVEVEFALMRTGELRLWYSTETTPALDADRLFQIAEQAYFFIKDAVHDHTHHDPSSDQITPLTRVKQDRRESGHGNEIAWRRETLWSLSREIERLQRKNGLISLRQSLGVIAYAEAFQNYLMGHERDETMPTRFRPATGVHDYDFKHLKDSVKASIDVASAKQSQRVQMILAGGGTFISMASLATSLVNGHNGVARAWEEPRSHYVGLEVPEGLLRFLVSNPLLAGALAAIALLVAVSYVLADGEGGLFNPFQRVISQHARAASVSLGKTDLAAYWWDVGFHVLCVLASFVLVALLVLGIWSI